VGQFEMSVFTPFWKYRDPEEIPMTLQAALQGTDGIVLASDMKINRVNQNFNSSTTRKKILVNEPRKIAACWSMDQFPSSSLAEYIVANLTDKDLQYPYPKLRNAATETLNKPGFYGERYSNAEVLVVTIENNTKAYDITANAERCDCFESSQILKGHIANPALFFTERYYSADFSISQLTRLAAHVILTASRISPRGIEGLEIVRCTKVGFDFLGREEINELTKWSSEVDSEIKRLLSLSP
jgi:hypothetical protein